MFLLFSHFARIAAARFHKEYIPLKSTELQQLAQHQWPGNVRELHAFAQRHVMGLGTPGAVPLSGPHAGLKQRLLAFEKAVLIQTLQAHDGCARMASESLGIPLHSLYYRMKRFDLLEKTGNHSDYKTTQLS